MAPDFHIACIQCNPIVGAIDSNAQTAIEHIQANQSADLIVLPELFLSGYPPEDLLFRSSLYDKVTLALNRIQKHLAPNQRLIIGHPSCREGRYFNELSVLSAEGPALYYQKQALPNYTVFDEKRYFTPGNSPLVISCKNQRIGLLICEDIWTDAVVEQSIDAGADMLIAINASPYATGKHNKRLERARTICQQHGCNLIYLNQCGGQDELVFDGQSFAMSPQDLSHLAPVCKPHTLSVTDFSPKARNLAIDITDIAKTYEVLTLGIRDYVQKNGFPGILLGLSGGVDSALVLALAVDALGPNRVQAVMMPSRYTSTMSLTDARTQAQALEANYQIIDIEPTYQSFLNTLAVPLAGTSPDTTEENIQARCRGVLLMALSNKLGKIVLSTGNKSEMAVGYSTLYGDLVGGFAPIKDIYKTTIYALCHYRNSISPVIPQRVLTRAPSAELADDQTDQDTLPSYDTLDQILRLVLRENLSNAAIVEHGFDAAVVEDVVKRVYRNEYKRRQAPIGIRISSHGFGKDRRYPITNHFRD